MVNVQCEACHGPGNDHVKWANGQDVSGSEKSPARKYLAPAGQRDLCTACHDEDNAPDFDFRGSLEKVNHTAK